MKATCAAIAAVGILFFLGNIPGGRAAPVLIDDTEEDEEIRLESLLPPPLDDAPEQKPPPSPTKAEMPKKTPVMRAYDCSDASAQTRTLDLTGPADCPDPERDYTGPTKVTAAIIKKKDSVQHPVYHCQMHVTRQINHCYGPISTSFGLATTAYEQPVLLDRESCIKAVEQRVFEYEGHVFKLPQSRSETMKRFYFSKGRVDNYDGTCYSESTTLPDGTFVYGIVEETRISLSARMVAGLWELDSGAMVVDEHLPGTFRTGELLDVVSGAYYWKEGDLNGACALSLTEVFMGSAELYVPSRPSSANKYTGSTLMVDSNNASQAIALVLGEPVLYCKVSECYVAKNLPGFAACFRTTANEEMGKPFQGSLGPEKYTQNGEAYDLIVRDAKDEAEWNRALAWSRSDFMDFAAAFEIHETMEDLVRAQCELERKTLYNKLQMMSGGANPHALFDIFGEGYTYVKVGSSVAYVTQCEPVLVELDDAVNCTLEVPVKRRGIGDNSTTEWMDPLTKVLYQYPTEVVCSSLMPVRWDLEGTWYCSQPGLVVCAAPEKLKPTIGSYTATLDLFSKAAKTPLMQPAQIAQRDLLYHQLSHREAVLVRVVQNAVKNGRGKGRIGPLISPQDVQMIEDSVSDRVIRIVSPYWLMDWFGTAAIRFWAVIMFVGAIIAMWSSCARGVLTYLHEGWDGGRTIIKIILSMLNVFYIPVAMWKYVAASSKQTWGFIYDFFDSVRIQKDIKTPDAELTQEARQRLRKYILEGTADDLGIRVTPQSAPPPPTQPAPPPPPPMEPL